MAERQDSRSLRATFALALVVLSVVYRLPPLVNAGTVDADAAIVGLQARHILHGELSLFLWGSGYQTSVDSFIAALFFALLGATPLALVLSTLLGHIALTLLVFATIARHLRARAAFLCVLPLVFTTSPLHTYILSAPRQAALTLVFAALFVLDGARHRASTRSVRLQLAVGGALAAAACFADPYALLFLPPLLAFGLVVSEAFSRDRALLVRGGSVLLGAAVGMVPLALLLHNPASVHGETTLSPRVLSHNLALLWDPCLPWLLGATAYVPRALLGYVAWEPGALVHALSRFGALLFIGALATGATLSLRSSTPRPLRALGGFGATVAALTLVSFSMSMMVMDLFSSRYLAALVLASPLAIAPVAFRYGEKVVALALFPFLASAAVSGWLGYGPEASGARVAQLSGGGAGDEAALEAALLARDVHVAVADYWVSYRLTFLSREALRVVPIHAKEDRYPPYRREYGAEKRAAYVFDPQRSREDLGAMANEAFGGEKAWGTPLETLHVGALTAVVFDKGGKGAP